MSDEVEVTNDQLVLISGLSGTGKSASLRNIRQQSRWLYLNSEAGKRLPFKNGFQAHRLEDPYQVHEALDHVKANEKEFDGLILDSLTFLMDMMETMYVINAKDTQKGWSNFAQFFKTMMIKIGSLDKPVIMTAHTLPIYNEKAMEWNTAVPIKGALKNQGVEAYFSTVVSPKKVPLSELAKYQNDLLNIDEEDEILGYKHVFQTRLTKETLGERIRSPMGMFTREQTFIDADAQLLLDHLHKFYH